MDGVSRVVLCLGVGLGLDELGTIGPSLRRYAVYHEILEMKLHCLVDVL
jgi:hypothetical protein